MAIAGQRFQLDLSAAAEDDHPVRDDDTVPPSMNLIKDVIEKFPSNAPQPPRAPQQPSTTGFPAHKKRTQVSAFKRAAQTTPGNTAPNTHSPEKSHDQAPRVEVVKPQDDHDTVERQRIDQENQQRLAAMSDEDIERERRELLATLSPSLVERLMKKADARDDAAAAAAAATIPSQPTLDPPPSSSSPSSGPEKATIPEPRDPEGAPDEASDDTTIDDDDDDDDHIRNNHLFDPDAAPLAPPPGLVPASSAKLPPLPRIHFPARPSPAPILDPSAPDFLEALHEKYYPDLPMDPAKLAWMAPVTTEDDDDDDDPTTTATTTTTTTNNNNNSKIHPKKPPSSSSYSPKLDSIPASALRFDFRGALLPPRRARELPVSRGLHHHADAPEAAGYTIPELARLGRSAFPAQRCVAFQTLGRILYRLGRGAFGAEGDDLVMGLWRCVDEGRVLEVLQREAASAFVADAAASPAAGTETGTGTETAARTASASAAAGTRTEAEAGRRKNGIAGFGDGDGDGDGDGGDGADADAGAGAGGTGAGAGPAARARAEAGAGQGHHRSAQTLAIEALWNWQRGGGQRWKAQ